MEMAEIGATPSGGVHRLALSDEDRGARDLFRSWCDAAGLETTIDTLGNMLARRTGTEDDAAPVLIGSHLDSQPMGGRFDGTLGVLAALEVVETLNDEGVTTRHPIEVVNWTNEEGSRFSPAMVCSGVFAGVFELDYALQLADANGFTMGDELERIGAAEFRNTHFSYVIGEDGVEKFVSTPELQSENSIGSDPLEPGQVWSISPGMCI